MNVEEFKKVIFGYTKEINENMNIAFHFLGEKYGLTLMQLRILMEIYRAGTHTVGSLAEASSVAGTNISTMCKRLEKEGFVQRIRDQIDERIVRIQLTEFGEKTILEIDDYLNNRISRILADDADETFKIITSGMDKINSLLQRIGRND